VNDPNPEPSIQSGAVDSHCHLFLLDGDPAEAVEQARAAGVDTLVCVGIDPESSRRSVALAETFPGIYATAGMHPHDASAFDARAGAEIEELLTHPRVVAVGECGLDFFRMRSPRPDQERALAAQLTLSKAYDLPFLAPQRLRGRDNTPSNVLEVIDAIATAREEPVETVRETTAANARTAFPRLLEGPLGDQV